MGARALIRARWWRRDVSAWLSALRQLRLQQLGEDARLIFLARVRDPSVWLGYADFADLELRTVANMPGNYRLTFGRIETEYTATMRIKTSTDERGIVDEDLCERCGAEMQASNMCMACGHVHLS